MRSPAVRLVLFVLAIGGVVLAAIVLRASAEPYVVTAIDYHFHDAHPTFPIAPGRDLVVKNAGRNVHNVTIEGLGFSRDVQPGQELRIDDIADQLEPGSYELFCKYHQDRGMRGVIVIAAG